jgi:hypothetical protein
VWQPHARKGIVNTIEAVETIEEQIRGRENNILKRKQSEVSETIPSPLFALLQALHVRFVVILNDLLDSRNLLTRYAGRQILLRDHR